MNNDDKQQPPAFQPQGTIVAADMGRSSKNKKIVVVILVILLIGAGVFLIVRKSGKNTAKVDIYGRSNESKEVEEKTKPLTEEESFLVGAKNTAEVKVTKSGFVPAVMTVKADTKVTWTTDEATGTYGVAANAGSKTTKFFGSKTDISLHNLYAARFTDAGTYTYHDTKNPTNNGTVIVTK